MHLILFLLQFLGNTAPQFINYFQLSFGYIAMIIIFYETQKVNLLLPFRSQYTDRPKWSLTLLFQILSTSVTSPQQIT